MNISPVTQNTYQPKPIFKAIIVDKLEPVLKRDGVTFFNNGTAMLDKPHSLFRGVKILIDALIENDKQQTEMVIDILDASRMYRMLKFLPKKIFENRAILGIIGAGANVTALQLDNKEVLSLATNLDTFDSRKFEDFDLPLKSSAAYPGNYSEGWYVRELGAPVTKNELKELEKRIKKKGYMLDDWRTEQACKVDGESYLLDFECAYIPTNQKSYFK